MNKEGLSIGDEMGVLRTAEIIEFDPTLIKVEVHRYSGSIKQRTLFPIVDKKFKGSRKKFWFLKDGVYYDIKIGDYIFVSEKTGEQFLVTKEKYKKIRKNGNDKLLISRLELE